jgi:hypothetical protein
MDEFIAFKHTAKARGWLVWRNFRRLHGLKQNKTIGNSYTGT